MKKYFFFSLCLVLIGCTNNYQVLKPTKTEIKAVGVVLNYYGGICNRVKGYDIKNGKKTTYFKLEISQSKLIEQYEPFLELPASNIAYMFYKNLGNEKSNYTHIKVKLTLKGGQIYNGEYSTEELRIFEKVEPVFYKASKQLIDLDYEGFISNFDSNLDSNEFISKLIAIYDPIDSAYAPSTQLDLTGFSFLEREISGNYEAVFHVAGIILYKEANIKYSYFIRPSDQTIMGMDFKW